MKINLSIKNFVTILQGMIMGLAEVIPGVSGSTFALVMGIYDNFINLLHGFSDIAKEILKFVLQKSSIKNIKEKIFELDFSFGIFLLLGMLLSIGIFSNVVSDLLEKYPNYLYGFFFGLIIASVSVPWREMKNIGYSTYFIILGSFVVTFLLLGLRPAENNSNPSLLFLFFGGIIGISGLILPGVSGSFILLLLGLYEYVINTIKDLTKLNIDSEKIIDLLFFALGLVTGFITFVRVIKHLYEKYPNYLLSFLIGIMLGSLRVIYPYFIEISEDEKIYKLPLEDVSEYNFWFVLSSILLGVMVVILLNTTKVDRNQIHKLEKES